MQYIMRLTSGKSKRDEILNTAYHLFRKKGYHACGLNEILQESHAGKSQLHHYFGSKQDLLREVMQFYAEKVLDETASFMNQIENLNEFEKLIDGSIRLAQSGNEIAGCLVGSMCAELALTDEVIRVDISHIFEKWKNLFSKGLTRLQAKGLLQSDANTDAMAEHFLVSSQGAFLMAKANKDLSIIRKTILESIQYIRSYST